MDEMAMRLNKIEDSYYGFIAAVLTYVKKSENRMFVVENYMNQNPDAKSSDILSFISDQPDFYKDAADVRVG